MTTSSKPVDSKEPLFEEVIRLLSTDRSRERLRTLEQHLPGESVYVYEFGRSIAKHLGHTGRYANYREFIGAALSAVPVLDVRNIVLVPTVFFDNDYSQQFKMGTTLGNPAPSAEFYMRKLPDIIAAALQ